MLKEESGTAEDTLAIDAYKMELERIKFLLKSYLRIRLAKIEKQLFYLIEARESIGSTLSKAEWKYAFTLCALRGTYLSENFMKMIPIFCREFEVDKPIPKEMSKPPKDAYIFGRVVKTSDVCQFGNV